MVSEFRLICKRHSAFDYRYNENMEDIERTPFGRRLFIARTEAGLSQEEAAKAVGMKSQSTLSEAEISGKRSGFTSQLATLYKVNPTWLATGRGSKEYGTPQPLHFTSNPILDNLNALPPHEAEIFRIKIQAAADIWRAKQRAALEASQQQEDHSTPKKAKDDPHIEPRRASG